MNENLDLTKILKGCPEGTKFYSTIYGDVCFTGISYSTNYPIVLIGCTKPFNMSRNVYVTKGGLDNHNFNGECTLFPSKDQRDWSKFERFWDKPKIEKFNPHTLQPFDKVLGFYDAKEEWECAFFSHLTEKDRFPVVCVGITYPKCIPYNEETKHLVGTKEDCPEYYKWWEE